MEEVDDLAIIGGGINGCGIARDAAGRGLTFYLCERNDRAGGASSWSTRLIHGGLRYLELYEFRSLRFVLPHHAGLHPAWLLRLGLFLYDHLGGRKRLPATATLDLRSDAAGAPLKPGYGSATQARTYGARATTFLGEARSMAGLGQPCGPDLTETEVRYRMRDEWAMTADDILWRRSKLGLRVSPDVKSMLAAFMARFSDAPQHNIAGTA